MKRRFFLNKVLMVCTFFCLVGCTQDTDIPDSTTNETKVKKRLMVDKTMDILVVYVKGTPERTKAQIREQYIRKGLLLSWEICDDRNVETWEADPVVYYAKDPVEDMEEHNEPMEKVLLEQNCEDYKGD
ncbi:hypothetical protein [Aquimarina sp. AU474]|uniref:hypothetical protein n=1 Tax=Aquimarina sp. AU474 TaxID=2108529 RepID=UPI000D692424|nr:hypothetical protein [Aquimarina sp. AU474]